MGERWEGDADFMPTCSSTVFVRLFAHPHPLSCSICGNKTYWL